ncbi:MAG: glycosyltransferase family 9 protein, partial [candidate division Zixibacteria bacterium]|nr:glycosyltransferase family 9 protein [candidate division Zixibacteria bacterium]
METRILIRTPNHLGDCVMALPMINETREAYPGAVVTVLTPEHLAELFQPNPGVDRVLTIPREHVHGLIGVFKIKEIIAEQEYDVGYILPPSFGAASGFKLAGVPERIGYIADGRRMLLTRPLILPTPLNSAHRSEVYFNLLRRGSDTEIEYTKPKMFLSQDDSDRASGLLEVYSIKTDDKYA